MRFASLAMTILALATAARALAQTDSEELPPPPPPPSSDSAAPRTDTLGESQRVRLDKSAHAALGYGFIVGGIPGLGLDASYMLTPDLALGVAYYTGHLDQRETLEDVVSEDGVKLEKADLATSLALLKARIFLANSFNLGLGLGERRVIADIAVRSEDADAQIESQLTSTSLVAHLTIGNHWAWDSGLTLGVDWVGYNAPITSHDDSDTSVSGADAPPETLLDVSRDAEDAAESIGKLGTWMLAVVSVGYLF